MLFILIAPSKVKITSLHRHIVNNINSIDRDNINISEYANYSVIINNVVNRSISENRVNINNFLNNEYVPIYLVWYLLYNFLFWWKRCRHY